MIKKIYLWLFCGFLLVGCSAYVDTKREAGQIEPLGQSQKNKPALCYNPLFGDEKQKQELANAQCHSHKATLKQIKYFNCSLFYPNTAIYECVSSK